MPASTIPFSERSDEIGALARSIGIFQQAMSHNAELNRTVLQDADTRAHRQQLMSEEVARISDQMLAASSQLAGAAHDAAHKTMRA